MNHENAEAVPQTGTRISRLAGPDVLVDPLSPWESWQRLSGRGPVATADESDTVTSWYLLGYQDTKTVLQDPSAFRSEADPSTETSSEFLLIPGQLDPPAHRKYRSLLNPAFSPRRIAEAEPEIRRACAELIDGLLDEGSCDFMDDFAFRFPTSVFLKMLGLDVGRTDEFVEYTHRYTRPRYDGDRQDVEQLIDAALTELFDERRSHRADDLASYLLDCQVDERPLTHAELMGVGRLLFIAGLDTVAATLGYAFHHLATRPQDLLALRTTPSLIPTAVEEFLRCYSVITSARTVVSDTTLGGCPMRSGDYVVMPLASANRDGSQYETAEDFVIDRSPNRHIGFGLGPHRCLGSHLARAELRIALEEWLKRVEAISVPDGWAPQSSGLEPLLGTGLSVPMLDSLPLSWQVDEGRTR